MSAFALLAGLVAGLCIGVRAGIRYATDPPPPVQTVFCEPEIDPTDYPSNYRHD